MIDAADGFTALCAARETPPDLVLLDVPFSPRDLLERAETALARVGS